MSEREYMANVASYVDMVMKMLDREVAYDRYKRESGVHPSMELDRHSRLATFRINLQAVFVSVFSDGAAMGSQRLLAMQAEDRKKRRQAAKKRAAKKKRTTRR